MISLELVVDDGSALLVPQHRHRHPPAVGGIRLGVELVDVGDAVDRVGHHALARLECPPVLCHQPVRHRHTDHAFEPLEGAEDQRAVGPRAGERHVEVIAAWLGLEAALAGRPRRAVGVIQLRKLDCARTKRPPVVAVSYHLSCQTPSTRTPMPGNSAQGPWFGPTKLSSRGLSPGSIHPLAPAFAESWIPTTSAGMTNSTPPPACARARAASATSARAPPWSRRAAAAGQSAAPP